MNYELRTATFRETELLKSVALPCVAKDIRQMMDYTTTMFNALVEITAPGVFVHISATWFNEAGHLEEYRCSQCSGYHLESVHEDGQRIDESAIDDFQLDDDELRELSSDLNSSAAPVRVVIEEPPFLARG